MTNLTVDHLGNLVTFRTGKLNSNAAVSDGMYPFFTCSQETFRTDTWAFDCECVLLGGNNANAIYPLKYFKGKFDAYQRTYVICSKDENLLDNRYLYYALQPKLELMRSISTGAATRFLTLSILNTIPIEFPQISAQRKIVTILSAYDDLIENNNRRIKILEEMAQSIYREWFVNFRFPGHEKVRMVDSKLGKIPEGWEIVKIQDVANQYRGRSYRSENIVDDGGIPFINLKCIERNGGFRVDGLKSYSGPFTKSQIAGSDDIVVAVTDMTQERRLVAHAARIPRLSSDIAVYSMDLVKLKPKRADWQEYLYGILRYSDFPKVVKQMANGVNVLHLNPSYIGTFEVVAAPQHIVKAYSKILFPIYKFMDILEIKNTNLRQTRDLLLPRLISGELDVSDLDIPVNNGGN